MAISKEKLIKYLNGQTRLYKYLQNKPDNDILKSFYNGYTFAIEETKIILSSEYFKEDPPAEETDNCFFCGCSSCNNECLDSDSDDY